MLSKRKPYNTYMKEFKLEVALRDSYADRQGERSEGG